MFVFKSTYIKCDLRGDAFCLPRVSDKCFLFFFYIFPI